MKSLMTLAVTAGILAAAPLVSIAQEPAATLVTRAGAQRCQCGDADAGIDDDVRMEERFRSDHGFGRPVCGVVRQSYHRPAHGVVPTGPGHLEIGPRGLGKFDRVVENPDDGHEGP
jgi:hypothetical protein